MPRRHWLVKSEPSVFSIQDLAKAPNQTTYWDGVRNFQARNLLQQMEVGDGVIFYHSSADPPGAAGTATVAEKATPDPLQWDPKSDYYDEGSKKENPRWFGVKIKYEKAFSRLVTLEEIKATKELQKMVLVQRSRLSVQPVTAEEFKLIVKMGK